MSSISTTKSEAKQKAGRAGGAATLARHGKEHFRRAGRAGARVFHARYRLVPVDLNDFAIVNRETGEVKARLGGTAWRA